DKVVRVKIDHAGVTVAAGERGDVVDVRFGRHGLHCGGDIVIDELMPDVSIKERSPVHFLHFLLLLHFLCFLHQSLPGRSVAVRIGGAISCYRFNRTKGRARTLAVWTEFRRTELMEYWRDHSGLILAVRMTFAHFSLSSAMNLAKSAAEPPNAMPPSSASRAFVVGSASAALIPWLSLSIISAG